MKKDIYFYGALALGVIALVAVLVSYNVKSRKQELASQQNIDLNEPVQLAEEIYDGSQTEEVTPVIGGRSTTEEATTEEMTEASTQEAAATQEDAADEANEKETVAENNNLHFTGEPLLQWPLFGNVILPYSMDTTVYFQTLDQYKCNPGMLIQAAEGDTVAAAFYGKVIQSAYSKEFGNMVVLDLGNGYQVTYGQLKDVAVKVGDMVDKGSTLGSVSAPSGYYTKEGTHVYFAVTKDGTPVNPMTVLEDWE